MHINCKLLDFCQQKDVAEGIKRTFLLKDNNSVGNPLWLALVNKNIQANKEFALFQVEFLPERAPLMASLMLW